MKKQFSHRANRLKHCPALANCTRAPVFALLGAFLSVATVSDTFAAAIYKSFDKDGNVIFTDQPLDGSESVNEAAKKAQAAQEASEAAAAEGEALSENEGPSEGDVENEDLGARGVVIAPQPKNPPKSEYKEPEEPTRFLPVTSVEILTPIHDATLIDPLDNIWVELQSFPTPIHKTGLIAQLWMDGQLITSGPRPMLSLPAPRRGTHELQVKLVDENGRLYLASQTVFIHVKYRVAEQ